MRCTRMSVNRSVSCATKSSSIYRVPDMAQIPIEHLLGREVTDPDGKVLGKIEEIVADGPDDALTITEYHLGPYAISERMALGTIIAPILHLFGVRFSERVAVPWDDLDLSDPAHPRSTKTRNALPTRRLPI